MNCNSLNGHPTEYGRRIKGIVCQGMLLINRDKWKRPIIIWERVMHLRVEYKAGTLCASWDNFTSSGYWASILLALFPTADVSSFRMFIYIYINARLKECSHFGIRKWESLTRLDDETKNETITTRGSHGNGSLILCFVYGAYWNPSQRRSYIGGNRVHSNGYI